MSRERDSELWKFVLKYRYGKNGNKKREKNLAFIDGQNLHMGLGWKIDYKRFRRYLKDKYNVKYAYYFLGFKTEQDLYENLQKAGFVLMLNLKGENLKRDKKGNVDVNLTFHIMRSIIEERFDKIILVSGDGDYKPVVNYLVKNGRFKKALVPNLKYASSLYKNHNELDKKYFACLDNPDLRKKFEYKRKRTLRH